MTLEGNVSKFPLAAFLQLRRLYCECTRCPGHWTTPRRSTS